MRIQFVGNRAEQTDKQLRDFSFPDILDIKDHFPKNVANQLMAKASALLLFYDDRFVRAVPGKFYDYLKAGAPIIVIGEKGEVVDIIKEFKAGYVIRENDTDALEKTLDSIMKGNSINKEKDKINEWLTMHTRRKIAERMFKTLDQLEQYQVI